MSPGDITGAGTILDNDNAPTVSVDDVTVDEAAGTATSFRGGVNVAGGDLDGDGLAEIVTGSGIGGGPVLKTFSAAGAPELSATSFGPDKIGGQPLRNGIRVAVHDIDGDGDGDVIAGSGPDYSASVSLRRGTDLAELSNFLPYEADDDDRIFTGRVYVG
ncbi:hypothetical protein [Urbifossiella limnaea]|uniref:VCBS repeat-containing protein n=1 Tax=Urbifossiella limnaea TaxID=2528023 RepID=A0A517Y1A8_9BACT|nr:hypothetical protein [Urbifossiella limnaea]QDU23549.1 hypothetical protein ETAA1_55500 [Urbifossiella limnaea]